MGARILVVNDTEEILELFRDILTEEGHEVILDSFAIHEVREIERVHPDLVILDYIMYGDNGGWQLLQKLKMYRPTASIPIIICTAATQLVRETQGFLESKGVVVVFKPFDIDELLNVVRRALEQPATIEDALAAEERGEDAAEGKENNRRKGGGRSKGGGGSK